MDWRWFFLVLLVTIVTGKGKKHRHQKPGRALLDQLSGSVVSEEALSDGDGLQPPPLDIAPYCVISANATCGEAGAEEFCRETPGKRGVVCDVCEGKDGSPSRRHPAYYAVDGDPSTWWQSPTQAAGEQYSHIELVATLPAEMELLHVIIKSGPSPRPLAWSLDVSSTESGDDWRMIKAFGDKEHCRRLWSLRPERRRRKARATRKSRADKTSCSTQFASPRPLENGEMHVSAGGAAARRVRVSLRAAHATDEPSRRYYTVRALTLAARCLCHGHAERCNVDAKGAQCKCVHGTCGAHCQRCCGGAAWAVRRACGARAARGGARGAAAGAAAGAGGEDCACGERGACARDDTGAILCVNCTENRAGPLCDRCLTGFYNAIPDGPCLACECDPDGSDGTCTWDEQHERITCSCYPGFTGFLCDACEDSSAVFPFCNMPITPVCKCDPRGVVDPTRLCDDICECKKNVVGEKCDACAPGHFGLSTDLVEGCRPCYCSHITNSCVANPEPGDDVVLPLNGVWLVTDAQGNETVEPSVDDQGKPYLISYEVEGWESFYWMTTALNGERLAAYGTAISAKMFWGVVRGDTGGNPTVGPDVILIGADGTKLAYGNTSHETPGELSLTVPLVEGGWYLVASPATSSDENESWPVEWATRLQLMDVLADVSGLMIRAYFHTDQDEVRLESAQAGGAGERSAGGVRERCACPGGYAGPWCERCEWSHARAPLAAAAPRFQCVPCACHGHAACDTVDGACGPCQHNTTGPHCERCLPGHYGNPVQGPCKPCACPLYLPSNNFSPNCALASAEGDEYVCTQCPDGYTGDHCEQCDVGYWGEPRKPGGRCAPCACGGAPCLARSGRCRACPPHAEGARCQHCQEGYWLGAEGWWEAGGSGAGAGEASGASALPEGADEGEGEDEGEDEGSVGVSCEPCACGAGALSGACDERSGQCACRQGFTGRRCHLCDHGHGGVDQGCPACACGAGALSEVCDRASGACACAAGAAPPRCDACLPDHYGLGPTGCTGPVTNYLTEVLKAPAHLPTAEVCKENAEI